MENKKIKIILDVIMTVLLVSLMKIAVTKILLHELIGLGLLFLFVVHKALNFKWIKNVSQTLFNNTKKITLKTKIKYGLDLLLLILFLLIGISGIIISKELFFFEVESKYIFHNIHISASYLALIFIGIHIGFNIRGIINTFKRIFKIQEESKVRKVFLNIIVLCLVIFGIYSSYEHNVLSKIALPVTGTADNTRTHAPQRRRDGSGQGRGLNRENNENRRNHIIEDTSVVNKVFLMGQYFSIMSIFTAGTYYLTKIKKES